MMIPTTTTGTCASCRHHGLDVAVPDPVQYPDAVRAAVCADCEPLYPAELGAAALTNPSQAERARAESLWRTVLNPAEPCRCSGDGTGEDGKHIPCSHGERCNDENYDENDEGLCLGRLVHIDRYAAGLISSPDYWEDVYACSHCPNGYTMDIRLPEMPWGVIKKDESGNFLGYDLFDGIRHMNFTPGVGE